MKPSSPQDKGSKCRIVVIEDDRNTNLLITENLRSEGYEVESVFDGKEGMKLALDLLPDLIVLDLILPEVDGWEVCRRLREQGRPTKAIPIMVISVMRKDQRLPPAMNPLVFVNKPFEVKTLIEEVRKVVGVP